MSFSYLQKDPASHVDMLDPIKRGTAELLYGDRDGVILREGLSGIYMASMENTEKCLSILEGCSLDCCAVHQEETARILQARHHFPAYYSCCQYIYPERELSRERLASIGVEEDAFKQVRLLDERFQDTVSGWYDTMDDPEYIRSLLQRKQLWGIFEEGKLAGFIGQHLEGSMGLLEVLPEYRRKGYGSVLEAFLIRHVLEQGRMPFCQVFEGNEASEALQKKLGLVRSKEKLWWLF